MVALQAQYIRLQTRSGGSGSSDRQLLKQAFKLFSVKGKLFIYKSERKEFYKSLLNYHHNNIFFFKINYN